MVAKALFGEFFPLGLLLGQPSRMNFRFFPAEKYPAHKSFWMPGFFSDHAPAGVRSRRELIIQSCNVELYCHKSDPAAPAPDPQSSLYQGLIVPSHTRYYRGCPILASPGCGKRLG